MLYVWKCRPLKQMSTLFWPRPTSRPQICRHGKHGKNNTLTETKTETELIWLRFAATYV